MKKTNDIKSFGEFNENLNISDVSDSVITFSIKSNGIEKSIFFFKNETEIGRIYLKEYIKFIYIVWIESKGYGDFLLKALLNKINIYKKTIVSDVSKDNNKSLYLFNRNNFKSYELYNLPSHIKDWYEKEKTTFQYNEDFFRKRVIFLYDYH